MTLLAKRSTIHSFISVLVSVVLFSIGALIVRSMMNVDLDAIARQGAELSVFDKGAFSPEPVEKMIFFFGIVFLPIFAAVSYFLLDRYSNNFDALKIDLSYRRVLESLLYFPVIIGCYYFWTGNDAKMGELFF